MNFKDKYTYFVSCEFVDRGEKTNVFGTNYTDRQIISPADFDTFIEGFKKDLSKRIGTAITDKHRFHVNSMSLIYSPPNA